MWSPNEKVCSPKWENVESNFWHNTSSSSSSSSLFVQIKIDDANKEHMIKPEQDSKVEKNTLTAALE